jgi:hypothetical protein
VATFGGRRLTVHYSATGGSCTTGIVKGTQVRPFACRELGGNKARYHSEQWLIAFEASDLRSDVAGLTYIIVAGWVNSARKLSILPFFSLGHLQHLC